MKTTVVSEAYQKLQKDMIDLQENWLKDLKKSQINTNKELFLKSGMPAVTVTGIDVDYEQFIEWICELGELLQKSNEMLVSHMKKVKPLLNTELAKRWVDEALAFNGFYFEGFAEEHELESWLPYFLAEQTVRPYLRLTAEAYQDILHDAEYEHGCPVCGEPVRLGHLEGEGKKVLDCPRCHASWSEKRLACSHCGNEDHNTIQYLSVEDDETAQIHACDECNGYIKVIDTRQQLKKQAPSMLDLQTIHLDYVAQEKGYGMSKNGGSVS